MEFEIRDMKWFRSVIFGMVFAFGWSPCFGPLLGSAVALAGNSRTLWQGILLLLLYSAGLGIPFMFTALLFDKVRDSIRAIQKYSRIINIVSGIILILAGVLVFTDRFKYLRNFIK
jgi:cytochrome c-type biogenesis protein